VGAWRHHACRPRRDARRDRAHRRAATLAGALNASESELQWFVTAYTLASWRACCRPASSGPLRRRALMVGALALFAAGSAGVPLRRTQRCSSPPAWRSDSRGGDHRDGAVDHHRPVQRGGAAPGDRDLGARTSSDCPRSILGGWILTNAWWGWIFLINVPVALIALSWSWRSCPSPGRRNGQDRLRRVLLSSETRGPDVRHRAGRDDAGELEPIVPVVAGLVLCGVRALGAPAHRAAGGRPLIDLSLFRSRSFTWGMILTAFGVFGLFGALFALRSSSRRSWASTRRVPAPPPAVVAGLIVGAVPADRVVARLGTKLTVASGFALAAVALIIGATTTATSGTVVAAWTFVVGAGAVSLRHHRLRAIVELPTDRSGVGSALLQTVVKLGPAFGRRSSAACSTRPTRATWTWPRSPRGRRRRAGQRLRRHRGGPAARSAALLASVRAASWPPSNDAMRIAAVVDLVAVVLRWSSCPPACGPPRPPKRCRGNGDGNRVKIAHAVFLATNDSCRR